MIVTLGTLLKNVAFGVALFVSLLYFFVLMIIMPVCTHKAAFEQHKVTICSQPEHCYAFLCGVFNPLPKGLKEKTCPAMCPSDPWTPRIRFAALAVFDHLSDWFYVLASTMQSSYAHWSLAVASWMFLIAPAFVFSALQGYYANYMQIRKMQTHECIFEYKEYKVYPIFLLLWYFIFIIEYIFIIFFLIGFCALGFRLTIFPAVVKRIDRYFGAQGANKEAAQQHAYRLAFVTEDLLEKLPEFILVIINTSLSEEEWDLLTIGTLASSAISIFFDLPDVVTWIPQLWNEGRPELTEKMRQTRTSYQGIKQKNKIALRREPTIRHGSCGGNAAHAV